ncbi:low molecular weight phosphatase family protein [Microbacterium limosum]|uniref:Low molecular weight phosphatase family protein n=1 Tax=Microbacterium limosum TaxID=3079935 RepID=A0AAU0MG95_9MICO|nr:low molecular weight phosphatase family protein [Microbacterium sp. Y20]WOQ69206.1 low molecular weight phosphatase family protein [Microbacterium sp. Y20]
MIELLTVCTGNVARSPLAEVLLRARLRGLGIRVTSAGTRALIGHPMTLEAQVLAEAAGARAADAEAHRARLLTERELAAPALVLAMAREHRRAAVELAPLKLRSTFTVREFARLAATVPDDALVAALEGLHDPSDRLRAALSLVSAARSASAPPDDPEDDDVVDPYRRSHRTYDLAAAQLTPAIDEVARVLRIVAGRA